MLIAIKCETFDDGGAIKYYESNNTVPMKPNDNELVSLGVQGDFADAGSGVFGESHCPVL